VAVRQQAAGRLAESATMMIERSNRWVSPHLRGVADYRELLYLLVWCDIKVRRRDLDGFLPRRGERLLEFAKHWRGRSDVYNIHWTVMPWAGSRPEVDADDPEDHL
jgi:hypothetical protein